MLTTAIRLNNVTPSFLRCSEAGLDFQFLGFLATVATICPPNAKCTCCIKKEYRCSGYNLPSPLLASPTIVPNFLATVVVQGLPPKILNFSFIYLFIYIYFLFGQTPQQCEISTLQRRTTALFLFGFVTAVRQNLAATASFCLFLLLFSHCIKFGLRCSG